MAKQPNKKFTPNQWIDSLDPEAIDEAREVALIDANGDYEQHTGFMTALQDELSFPSTVKVQGDVVTMVAMEWPVPDATPTTMNWKGEVRELVLPLVTTESYAAIP